MTNRKYPYPYFLIQNTKPKQSERVSVGSSITFDINIVFKTQYQGYFFQEKIL